METKICTKCKRDLPIDKFSKLKDGYQLHCKECKAEYYWKRRDEINQVRKQKRQEANPKEVLLDGLKRCPTCNEVKSVTEFGKLSNTKDGLRYTCKACRKIRYNENREHIINKSRKYYKENKSEIIVKTKEYKDKRAIWYQEYFKNYYQNNKKAIKQRAKENLYQRMEDDIGFKILQRCRTRLYQAVKGHVKSASTQKLIGCTVEELIEHLEKQFKEGMSWDNYGDWHIDHIIPCASFDFSKKEDQYTCFNYKNLQPLWAEENFAKKDKIQASL